MEKIRQSANPYVAYALVKNFHSNARELSFENFSLCKVGYRNSDEEEKFQRCFRGTQWPDSDWFYRREYKEVPEAKIYNEFGRIPYDIEDTLLLLRLFKPGDIIFTKPFIQKPDDSLYPQLPYRAMSEYPSSKDYRFETSECAKWDIFARELIALQNWNTAWFQTAHRFFLYGGAKEFRFHSNFFPPRNEFDSYLKEVDRVVDYCTALEATLVPERDFVGVRLRERAARLIENNERDILLEDSGIIKCLKDFYNVRSAIVPGSELEDSHRQTLYSADDFEWLVRKVLVSALRKFPFDESQRKTFLSSLYDVPDEKRLDQLWQDFCSIKDKEMRRMFYSRITKSKKV